MGTAMTVNRLGIRHVGDNLSRDASGDGGGRNWPRRPASSWRGAVASIGRTSPHSKPPSSQTKQFMLPKSYHHHATTNNHKAQTPRFPLSLRRLRLPSSGPQTYRLGPKSACSPSVYKTRPAEPRHAPQRQPRGHRAMPSQSTPPPPRPQPTDPWSLRLKARKAD